jgi:hypothetical protein
MNRQFYLLVPLIVFSCVGKYNSDAPQVKVNQSIEHGVVAEADTLIINLKKSNNKWGATEMRGAKRRTGII